MQRLSTFLCVFFPKKPHLHFPNLHIICGHELWHQFRKQFLAEAKNRMPHMLFVKNVLALCYPFPEV